MRIKLIVNGVEHALEVEPRTTLLDCLRDHLNLKGAHAGCEHGVCGACTVLFDGVAVRSCLMFSPQAEGTPITTIEGITPGPGELSALQDAFCETHGLQCGYCTPAMILWLMRCSLKIRPQHEATSSRRFQAISAVALAMPRSWKR